MSLKCYCSGYLHPVTAGADWTHPVGQSLGKLYTPEQASVLPEVSATDNGALLQAYAPLMWLQSFDIPTSLGMLEGEISYANNHLINMHYDLEMIRRKMLKP